MDGDSEGPQMELAGKTQDIDLPGCSKDLLVGKGGKESLLVGLLGVVKKWLIW